MRSIGACGRSGTASEKVFEIQYGAVDLTVLFVDSRQFDGFILLMRTSCDKLRFDIRTV